LRARQKAAGAALSAKNGDTPMSERQGTARGKVETMTEQPLEELAHTRPTGLLEHVDPD
jgi:hypothetical protein